MNNFVSDLQLDSASKHFILDASYSGFYSFIIGCAYNLICHFLNVTYLYCVYFSVSSNFSSEMECFVRCVHFQSRLYKQSGDFDLYTLSAKA